MNQMALIKKLVYIQVSPGRNVQVRHWTDDPAGLKQKTAPLFLFIRQKRKCFFSFSKDL